MSENRSAGGEEGAAAEPGHSQQLAFLQQLGERVRSRRSGRGMSRKALARHADVSERYLAQLEGGKGNLSILLLRRVARALGVPLFVLIDERPDDPIDNLLLERLLERLAPAELAQARDLLLARFGASPPALRRERIALIGLRGGGKSTLGRLLGERLGRPFIELDREIENLSGMRLGEIFEMFGQETYRRAERTALETLLHKHDKFVVATGGSLVTEPATFELLLSSCFTVWVRTEPNAHMQRVIDQGDLRPMADSARAMDDLLSILKSREPLYAKADFILDTANANPEESLRALMDRLGPAPDEP